MGKIGDLAEVNSGKTCNDKSNKKDAQYKYPVAGASGIIGFSSIKRRRNFVRLFRIRFLQSTKAW